jgi:SNF family Na+-dependent transporter
MSLPSSESKVTVEQWGTRIGVIMAVAGSAVGIGNYLRFPGLVAQHGGGAFMIPYFAALLILGIPLSWAEWTMGRYGGIRGFNSAPGIYSVIWRRRAARYCGSVALLIPLIIYMYYVLIESWCLSYAINYITGDLMSGTGGRFDQIVGDVQREVGATASSQQITTQAFGQFFHELIGSTHDGAAFLEGNRRWIAVLAIVFLLNFVCIYRGLSRGIEKLCNIGMPVLFLLSFVVLFRVLSLGTPDPAKPDQNLINGLGFMWNPHLEPLKNPEAWLAAAGQIFFTLSVGFGIIINYASYLKPKDDDALSSLTAASMNEFSEVCHGGLITIPASFVFLGALAPQLMNSTFDMGFVALPNVFDAMWGGRVFGFMWFFMLFIADIAASVSMLQPCIAFLEEGLGLRRHASVAFLSLVAAFGCGFVLYFSKDSIALDTFDFWVGTFLMFLLALFQSVLYGWVLGIDRGNEELHRGAQFRVPYFVQYVLKYVTPLYLIAIFVLFCFYNIKGRAAAIIKQPVALSSICFILVLLMFLLLLTHIAGRRWEREGRLSSEQNDA